MLLRGLAGFLVIWLASASARAGEATPGVAAGHAGRPAVVGASQEVNVGDERRWYGEPILIGDGTAYLCLLIAAGFEMKETTQVFVPPAALGYALVGPITHAAHGNWGRATLSLTSRALLPLTGVVLAINGCDWSSEDCSGSLVGGLVLGMLGATVLDAAALARDRVPKKRTSAGLVPLVGFDSRSAFVGATGAF